MIIKTNYDTKKYPGVWPFPLYINKVQMLHIDPPWQYDRNDKQIKKRTKTNFNYTSTCQIISQINWFFQLLKPGGHAYIWVTNQFAMELGPFWPEDCRLASVLTWIKPMGMGWQYRNTTEHCLMITKNMSKNKGALRIPSRSLPSHFIFPRPKGWMKPIDMIRMFVLQSTSPSDTIVDPWAGDFPWARVACNRRLWINDVKWNKKECHTNVGLWPIQDWQMGDMFSA